MSKYKKVKVSIHNFIPYISDKTSAILEAGRHSRFYLLVPHHYTVIEPKKKTPN